MYSPAPNWWTFRWFSTFYCKQGTKKNSVRHVNSSMYHIAGLIPRRRHARQRPWTFVFDQYCLINFHTYGISLYSHHQWKVISLSSPQDSMLTVHMYKSFNRNLLSNTSIGIQKIKTNCLHPLSICSIVFFLL